MHHFKNTDTASTIKANVRAAQIGGLEASSCNTGAAVTCNVTKIEYKDRFRYMFFFWKQHGNSVGKLDMFLEMQSPARQLRIVLTAATPHPPLVMTLLITNLLSSYTTSV